MKLQPNKPDYLSISAYDHGCINIKNQRYTNSLILTFSGKISPWSCTSFEELTPAHFSSLLLPPFELPEIIIFGSGKKLRFLHPCYFADLIDGNIGVETMDTAAACRTYNILAEEGRKVVAALLIEN